MNKLKLKKETTETLKFIGVLILIYLVLSLLFKFVPPMSNYNIFAIQTDSMEPIISPGDIVITKKIKPEDVKVGDIMAFYVDINSDLEDDVVVHYINEINTFGDKLIFKTNPNVSDIQDRWTIEEVDLIGIYTYQINNMGKILQFAQSWIGRIMILIDIIVISVAYDILFSKKKASKDTLLREDSTEKEEK